MTDSLSFRALRHASVVAVMALSTLAAIGNACAAADSVFEVAFQHFLQAAAGDGSAGGKAVDEFDALRKAEPANPVLLAYAGAATTLQASTTMLPWKKMSYAEDGLALLDKALAMLRPVHDAPMQHGTPGSLEVRFVAANTFLAVPGFMNRSARGAKLLDEVLASPAFASAPLPFQGGVWMRAAGLAVKEGRRDDARRYLDEVIARGAPQAAQAQALRAGVAS
jgi:hypothetical protein